MIKIIYSAKAGKQFLKLSKKQQEKILKKIKILKTNPFLGKKLKGEFKGLTSFKAWPYRIIYQVSKKQKAILLVVIEYRQSVYN